jgi:hypothetical protein
MEEPFFEDVESIMKEFDRLRMPPPPPPQPPQPPVPSPDYPTFALHLKRTPDTRLVQPKQLFQAGSSCCTILDPQSVTAEDPVPPSECLTLTQDSVLKDSRPERNKWSTHETNDTFVHCLEWPTDASTTRNIA